MGGDEWDALGNYLRADVELPTELPSDEAVAQLEAVVSEVPA